MHKHVFFPQPPAAAGLGVAPSAMDVDAMDVATPPRAGPAPWGTGGGGADPAAAKGYGLCVSVAAAARPSPHRCNGE